MSIEVCVCVYEDVSCICDCVDVEVWERICVDMYLGRCGSGNEWMDKGKEVM